MKSTNPLYKRLLVIVVVIWMITMTYYVSNLYCKVGEIAHALVHR